jgi:hypothetical protein
LRLRQVVLTSGRDFFHTRRCLEPGSGHEAFLPEPYTVRYEAVNAMLLNEFLKEHRKVQELQATVVEQKERFESKLTQQQKQIEALAAGLQKVSAQLELNKAAPQTVLNDNQTLRP